MYILLPQILDLSLFPLIRDDFILNKPLDSPVFFCEFLFGALEVLGTLVCCTVRVVVVRLLVFGTGSSLSAAALLF